MIKPLAIAAAAVLLVTSLSGSAGAGVGDDQRTGAFTPGAAGAGDPYFPLAGNGGYDVQHYSLNVKYNPDTDELRGLATISAKATQNLSAFNLDLDGLNVRWIKVNGVRAHFSRDGGELTVVPNRGLSKFRPFTVVVKYDGVPEPVVDSLGISGFMATDDGTLVMGEPKVASTWFPVNDHPTDTASYSFRISVPEGLQAMANGVLKGTSTSHGWTTWNWFAVEPMASYLAMMAVGEFDVRAYQQDGVKYWDAIDPDLFDPIYTPNTGTQFAWSQQDDLSYKRLSRIIAVPDVDAPTLSFWAERATEDPWDFFFVEAHTPGIDDWTTLPENSGITSGFVGFSCPVWLTMHPFLLHYQTDTLDGTCSAVGSSGTWNAVTGQSEGREHWELDLSEYRGSSVEISLTYASDDIVQRDGVAIDDIAVTGGDGDTGFEDDGDTMDGWTTPGGPSDSVEPNDNDWAVIVAANGPATIGDQVDSSLGRQPEIIDFLAGFFGKYPFNTAGGIVDDADGIGFALENQTRPIYAKDFFTNSFSGDSVVVHELAHQWFGDDLPVAAWQDIWLNEGFATYAEWLWSDYEGLGSPQDNFDFFMTIIPEDDPFWSLTIGDPSADFLFEAPVYLRGGMTLHALRLEVGDTDFFRILKTWARVKSGQNVSTDQFIRLSERISGEQLDGLFQTWLYTPTKPVLADAPFSASRVAATSTQRAPAVARSQMLRWGMTVR